MRLIESNTVIIIALLCAVQRGDHVLDTHQACNVHEQKHATKRIKACITRVKIYTARVKERANHDKTAKKITTRLGGV